MTTNNSFTNFQWGYFVQTAPKVVSMVASPTTYSFVTPTWINSTPEIAVNGFSFDRADLIIEGHGKFYISTTIYTSGGTSTNDNIEMKIVLVDNATVTTVIAESKPMLFCNKGGNEWTTNNSFICNMTETSRVFYGWRNLTAGASSTLNINTANINIIRLL